MQACWLAGKNRLAIDVLPWTYSVYSNPKGC